MSSTADKGVFSFHMGNTSTLSEWFRWLVILAVVTCTLLVTYFFGAIDVGMYVVISGLGIILIGRSYLEAKYLHHETILASRQVCILEKVDSFEEFLAQTEPSMFSNHIENLHIISRHTAEISQDNLIALLHQRLHSRNSVVELFASILITLGLIGTIIGLIIMMNSLSDALERGGDLLAEVQEPLSGLGTAFYTTLLGAVFGGVVLRVLGNIVSSNITRYVMHIAELTEVYVLPYMRKQAVERTL